MRAQWVSAWVDDLGDQGQTNPAAVDDTFPHDMTRLRAALLDAVKQTWYFDEVLSSQIMMAIMRSSYQRLVES